jgi:hypothetical protein
VCSCKTTWLLLTADENAVASKKESEPYNQYKEPKLNFVFGSLYLNISRLFSLVLACKNCLIKDSFHKIYFTNQIILVDEKGKVYLRHSFLLIIMISLTNEEKLIAKLLAYAKIHDEIKQVVEFKSLIVSN